MELLIIQNLIPRKILLIQTIYLYTNTSSQLCVLVKKTRLILVPQDHNENLSLLMADVRGNLGESYIVMASQSVNYVV